tara:strand:- start:373 stop:603 length:231 start_codon:yes stop_codon:yes gene_type:complete
MSKLKFVWEFYGPDSKQLSIHHLNHLKEFLIKENIINHGTGSESNSENSSITYVVLEESYLEIIKKTLRPHKAFKV